MKKVWNDGHLTLKLKSRIILRNVWIFLVPAVSSTRSGKTDLNAITNSVPQTVSNIMYASVALAEGGQSWWKICDGVRINTGACMGLRFHLKL